MRIFYAIAMPKVLIKNRFILLIIPLLVCAVLVGWFFYPPASEEAAAELPSAETLSTTYSFAELFAQGQYYFNHDDDPAGPYDIFTAKKYYEAAILNDPKGSPIVWYQLGRIDFILGNSEAALYRFAKQIEYFGEEVPNVYYMLGLTHGFKARQTGNAEDWERGAEAFSRFIEFEPAEPWPRVDLAWIYFAQGKYAEMIPVLEIGLDHSPSNPWLLNMYGLALLNTGEKDKARIALLDAKRYAAELTPHDWGVAYSGNNPADWERGLREFQGYIDKNLALTEE